MSAPFATQLPGWKKQAGSRQQKNDLAVFICQGRLRSYEELASTLTTW